MNTINITATPNQIIIWLEKAEASANRAYNTEKRDDFKRLHQQEIDSIRRTITEIRNGGIQTELEGNKKK